MAEQTVDAASIAQELIAAGPSTVIDLLVALDDALDERNIDLADLVAEVREAGDADDEEYDEGEEAEYDEEEAGPAMYQEDANVMAMEEAPATIPQGRQRITMR